jgi:hypothetical protein
VTTTPFQHRRRKALTDDLRADETSIDVDLLTIRVAGERNLAEARDHQRVHEPEQDREDDDRDG